MQLWQLAPWLVLALVIVFTLWTPDDRFHPAVAMLGYFALFFAWGFWSHGLVPFDWGSYLPTWIAIAVGGAVLSELAVIVLPWAVASSRRFAAKLLGTLLGFAGMAFTLLLSLSGG